MELTKNLAIALINEYRNLHQELGTLETEIESLLERRNALAIKLEGLRTQERSLIDKIKLETGKEFSIIEFIQNLAPKPKV